jgi:hypothetical protein
MSVLVRFCQKIEELNNLKLFGPRKQKGQWIIWLSNLVTLRVHDEDEMRCAH